MSNSSVDPFILEHWVKGWSLAREVSPPEKYGSGYKTAVNLPDMKTRYVFPAFTPECKELAVTINEPYVFLKLCMPPEEVAALLPPHWIIDTPAFMMTCPGPMHIPKNELPPEYTLEVTQGAPVSIARIRTASGEVAAIGRIATVGTFGIYDRIETHAAHRRRGLGSIIMKTLEATGAARGATQGLLVATQEGKALYLSLGWQQVSPYTTAMLPAEKPNVSS